MLRGRRVLEQVSLVENPPSQCRLWRCAFSPVVPNEKRSPIQHAISMDADTADGSSQAKGAMFVYLLVILFFAPPIGSVPYSKLKTHHYGTCLAQSPTAVDLSTLPGADFCRPLPLPPRANGTRHMVDIVIAHCCEHLDTWMVGPDSLINLSHVNRGA